MIYRVGDQLSQKSAVFLRFLASHLDKKPRREAYFIEGRFLQSHAEAARLSGVSAH
jgi:hypothetical protein